MYTIEIFDRKTKEIIETKKVNRLSGFMTYWAMQCDSKKYDYTIIAGEGK